MNELKVKTLKFEPAVVEFNYDELSNILESNLKKYQGLTFNADDVAEGKKTVAELRKGKKAVDEYRKTTKKKLTESVTEFENQCKDLNKQFDQVLNPIVNQMDEFETRRKTEKHEEVRFIIDVLCTDNQLENEFASELVVEDEYLNKGKTIKSIKDELTLKAETLKSRQNTHNANKELISNTVELINERCQVSFSDSAYIRLLDYKDVGEIKQQIVEDGEREVEKAKAKERAEKERVERVVEEPKPFDTPFDTQMETPFDKAFENETQKEELTFYEIYKITATEKQIYELEQFMKDKGITFEITSA